MLLLIHAHLDSSLQHEKVLPLDFELAHGLLRLFALLVQNLRRNHGIAVRTALGFETSAEFPRGRYRLPARLGTELQCSATFLE